MKVLQPPATTANRWPKRIKCQKRLCRAVLEIEESDVKFGDFGCPRDENDVELRFYVECPFCKETIFSPDANLPDTLKLKLREECQHRRS